MALALVAERRGPSPKERDDSVAAWRLAAEVAGAGEERPMIAVGGTRAVALVLLCGVVIGACSSDTGTPPPSAAPSASTAVSARPAPSLDVEARNRIHDACVAADRASVARGGVATVSDGFALEAASEQGGRWVLLYGDGTRFVTCMQRQLDLAEGFYISSAEPWSPDLPIGSFQSCTNYGQNAVFYCVGLTDLAAAEVVVSNSPDATVQALPGPHGHFVVSFPYEGSIRTDGKLGTGVQISFIDACGHQFVPITMAGQTPCPRPR